LALAERARQLSGGRDPQSLDAMAAAYAALGEWDQAIRAATAGIAAAEQSGQQLLAADMRGRLDQYQQHQAVRR
jgi:hypothetical protein